MEYIKNTGAKIHRREPTSGPQATWAPPLGHAHVAYGAHEAPPTLIPTL